MTDLAVFRYWGRVPGLVALCLLLGSGCMATRLARPAYEGVVVDALTRQPLPEVKVALDKLDLTTDAQGKFSVSAITYRELTFPGGEAPAIYFAFRLQKPGYCPREVKHFDARGGGSSPAYIWKEEISMTPSASGCDGQP